MEKSFDILIMAPFAIQKKVIGISNDMRVDDDRRNCKWSVEGVTQLEQPNLDLDWKNEVWNYFQSEVASKFHK